MKPRRCRGPSPKYFGGFTKALALPKCYIKGRMALLCQGCIIFIPDLGYETLRSLSLRVSVCSAITLCLHHEFYILSISIRSPQRVLGVRRLITAQICCFPTGGHAGTGIYMAMTHYISQMLQPDWLEHLLQISLTMV